VDQTNEDLGYDGREFDVLGGPVPGEPSTVASCFAAPIGTAVIANLEIRLG